MNAREERLLTPQTIAAVDQWLDDADVFAKGYWQYVDGQLVTVGLRIGQDWTKVVAFFGDTVVRHEDGSHTVLSAKDAAELARLRQERHETNEALSDAAVQLRAQRDRIAGLEAAAEKVARFCAKRAEYVRNARDYHPGGDADYWRWNGHAEARRQLSQLLGLPVAWPAEDATEGELSEQRHLVDPLDHAFEALAPRGLPTVPQQLDRRAT